MKGEKLNSLFTKKVFACLLVFACITSCAGRNEQICVFDAKSDAVQSVIMKTMEKELPDSSGIRFYNLDDPTLTFKEQRVQLIYSPDTEPGWRIATQELVFRFIFDSCNSELNNYDVIDYR